MYCLSKLEILQEDNRISDSIIAYQKKQVSSYAQIIEAQNTKYDSLECNYTDLNKRYKQDIRKSKTKIIGVGVGGIISGIIVGVLLI